MRIWMRTLMIAVGSVAFAGSLRAEPIPWNYSTTLLVLGGPTWLDAYPDQVVSGGTANSTTAAVVWGNSGGIVPLSGSRTVTVGEAHPGATFAPNDYYLQRGFATTFDFVFNLQDGKSGQTVALSFVGRVEETITRSDDGPPYLFLKREEKIMLSDPSLGTPWLATKSLRLGENDYHIDLKERMENETSYIDAVVQVEKVTEAPEPSTVAMGAIGLAGLALGWRRRQRGR